MITDTDDTDKKAMAVEPLPKTAPPPSGLRMLGTIVFTLLIPVVILSKFSSENTLGPVYALVVALLFPVIYFFKEYIIHGEKSWISVLGFVNVVLTGGFGLMQLDGIWFALKEASIPFVIAVFLGLSQIRGSSQIHRFLFNASLFDVSKLHATLDRRGSWSSFHRLLRECVRWVIVSFLLSSVLNFSLAYVILQSPTGTEAFNQELARMQLLSYPVIMLPCVLILILTFYRLNSSFPRVTGMRLEEFMWAFQGKDHGVRKSEP